MVYKDGADILLALTIASDKMMHTVNMFPEVIYMGVTSGTNKQKQDLFIMVVNYGNEEIYIRNGTIIPS